MSEQEPRLHLEQHKRRAKELRDAVRAGDPAAIARVHTHHPGAARLAAGEIPARLGRLSDAQLVIARELGLAGWPALKAHIDGLDGARRAIAGEAAAPDADLATLHVRCGSDIRRPLADARFRGDFLEVSDPLCMGPLVGGDAFVRTRARFLADAFALDAGRVEAEYLATEARLAGAAERYRRVVLWFEHDSYDQLILARVLSRIADAGATTTAATAAELVCIDRFPAVPRFIGLGQLTPEALRLLWAGRVPLTAAQARLGAAVWQALCATDPSALAAIAAGGTPELPQMGPALRRHLQELPWTRDGLSLTQRLVLEALRRGPLRGDALFAAAQEREPLPYLGDGMLWAILRDLARAAQPPFTVAGDGDWGARVLTLTDCGRALVDGALDWMTLPPPERWVGGVRIAPDARAWRWSPERDKIVAGA